jgi:hypothetical protein
MKLSIDFETTDQEYTILLMIYHKDTCILRSAYKCFYTNSTKRESIELLQSKLNETCMHNAPLELFSDDSIHNGSSMAMTFANGAFLYAHTIMPTNGQQVTTNNVYLLRPEELLQFYCELHKLLDVVRATKKE